MLTTLYPLIYFLAIGFGSGLLPKAPGTWGTMMAIPLFLLTTIWVPEFFIWLTLLMTIIGIGICHVVALELKRPDPPEVVWDEICGYFITMCCLPHTPLMMPLGFFAFRCFDIWKPQPIGWIEKIPFAGLAVMLDDVIAAFYAVLSIYTLWLCQRLAEANQEVIMPLMYLRSMT